MTNIYDQNPNELISRVADKMKKIGEISPPDWANWVKTGVHKERPPVQTDWWYLRSAAILRSVYKLGPIGVAKLRVKYGGKKDRGMQPSEFRKGSGNIIRKVLQQLEEAGLVESIKKGTHKGRKITSNGIKLLNSKD